MKRRAVRVICAVVFVVAAGVIFWKSPWYDEVMLRVRGKETVGSVVERLGADARGRLAPSFERAGIEYPPQAIVLVAFKEERVLELWAVAGETAQFVCDYPIRGASGTPGPKLREGDRQVPEGIYAISAMNPNSAFHLSLKVDYPNVFDQEKAALDGRTNPGGDIFIHGGAASIGCLAMGDEAIEELFVLVADVGMENVSAVIAPRDLRTGASSPEKVTVEWAGELYSEIAKALERYQRAE